LAESGGASRILLLGPGRHFALGLRRLTDEIPYTDEVISGGRESEDPSHLEDSAMPNLPQQRDRLQPSEALFNAFPFP
jgi:hypothetical protein